MFLAVFLMPLETGVKLFIFFLGQPIQVLLFIFKCHFSEFLLRKFVPNSCVFVESVVSVAVPVN